MKILFLTNSLDRESGGWGRYSYEIIHRINQCDDIQVTALSQEKGALEFVKPILIKANSLKRVPTNALKVREYIKQCDIIHALDAYPYGVIAALANIGFGKKLIINGVGTYSVKPLEQFLKKNLLVWAYKNADKILCISRFTQKEILKRVELSNTKVVNLGVDTNKFQNVKRFKKKEKIIVSVGGLKLRKGYHISIPAVAQAGQRYSDIKYYIVGDQFNKDYFRRLKQLAKDYNFQKNIFFIENISDNKLIKLYHKSDIFLLTPININNNFEGFGLVYLEANACGLPVIGSYNCGAEDIIRDNYNGLLVPQNDIKSVAQAILKLINSPNLAYQLGGNGRKTAQKMNWDNVVAQYVEVYNSLLR